MNEQIRKSSITTKPATRPKETFITKKVRSSHININQRLQQGEESTTKETSILTPWTRLITRGATLTLTLAGAGAGVGRGNSNDAPV